MMVYLTNIVYGIKGLELMTGIGCCEPSYCLENLANMVDKYQKKSEQILVKYLANI